MEQENWILKCAVFIEEHLKEELSVKRISQWAGYSPWYFSRSFKDVMGVSPMEYVKKRRLFAAAKEIRKGCKILDAALQYGWETHSGFTKSFCSQFGYSPVLLRAFYVHNASVRGEGENMGIYLKTMELYKKPEELWEILCSTLKENGVEYDRENLRKIYELAFSCHLGQKRKSGEDYITHPLNVAVILADMGADEETVSAGLLHDISTDEYREKVRSGLISQRIQTVLNAYRDSLLTYTGKDERGILVALADRLHNMRTIEFIDQSTWKQRAEETMRIFSPIASKVADIRLRSELDELSIKRLDV